MARPAGSRRAPSSGSSTTTRWWRASRPTTIRTWLPAAGAVDPSSSAWHARYLTAVRFVDGLVGQVLDDLRAASCSTHLVVIVTSDHGMEFDENGLGFTGHGTSYSDYQMHTPLVLRWPGRPAGRVERRTSHNDVAPTFLSGLFGCTNPPSDYSSGHEPLLRRPMELARRGELHRVRPARAGPGDHRLPDRLRDPRPRLSPDPARHAAARRPAERAEGDGPVLPLMIGRRGRRPLLPSRLLRRLFPLVASPSGSSRERACPGPRRTRRAGACGSPPSASRSCSPSTERGRVTWRSCRPSCLRADAGSGTSVRFTGDDDTAAAAPGPARPRRADRSGAPPLHRRPDRGRRGVPA